MTALLLSRWRRVHLRALGLLLVGNALIFLTGFFWLHIPDSRTWQLVLTFALGAGILAAFIWMWTLAVRRLRTPPVLTSIWLGRALLVVWLALGSWLCHAASHIDDNAMQRAGYWNSKLSPHLRTVFTFERLQTWQHDLVLALIWVVVPALLLPFLIETVSRGLGLSAWRAALRVLFRWQHWLAVVVAFLLGYWSTNLLMRWRPLHTVKGEVISVALRVTLAYIVDMLLLAFLLAFIAELLARADASQSVRRDTAP